VTKRGRTIRARWPLAVLAAGAVAWAPTRAVAHEIPVDVVVQAFVKIEGGRLRLLVRVPLEAMRDMEFPQRGPGYLDVTHADRELRDAARLWIAGYVELYENGRRLGDGDILAARVSLPSDRSFVEYDRALAHVQGPPLPETTEIYWKQAMLDVLIEYPVRSAADDFSIRPTLARLGLRVVTALRFLPPGGAVRAFEYVGDPGLVRLDPRWYQAALRFVGMGFQHILSGLDHLLFLLCLVIPFRRLRGLVPVVTAFTAAHSVTLIGSAYGLAPRALWFPPLVETLIAASIVYMALENIAGAKLRRRWIIAFGFGLVHGFGFSFALTRTLQFAGRHLLTSLLSFNLGVELGQLLVLVLAIPVLDLLFRFAVAERMGTIILSALVAHTAWHWMTARGSVLLRYHVPLPSLDPRTLPGSVACAVLILVLGALAWLVAWTLRHPVPSSEAGAALTAEE
jgi:HupE / UreJ protein